MTPGQYFQAAREAEDGCHLKMILPADQAAKDEKQALHQEAAAPGITLYEVAGTTRQDKAMEALRKAVLALPRQRMSLSVASVQLKKGQGFRQAGQPSSDTSGLAPGRTITARGTQKPKDKGKAHPAITNYDDEDDGNDAQSHTDSKAPVRRKGTSLPVDLPTTYYEALRLADAPSAYINYPARIHHLKYPAEESTPSVGHKWEDIHLHQKVSSPRLDTRWTRPATAADIERSRDFFVRFHAAGYEPFMGFRPYTDILFLDGQYMAAVLSRCRPNAATPEHDADSLVPFLTTSDRVKVRILAVAASAFGYAQRARVCAALVRAFPSLARVFLVSVATVPRPLSAAWDLETEFARWIRMSEAAQVEAQRTEEVVGGVGAYGVEHGLLEEEDGSGGSPLAEELEASFVLARESGRRTADNRAQAEQDLEKKREPVDWDKVDYRKMLHPRTSTSDRSTGSSRSSGVTRKVQVEAYIMLYFQDAFDRAVSNGLSEELDRTSVKYLNLDMK
ncbi:hypothetical protein N0V93_002404 [Gnomoniopsis smithogilvyi]|uniref:Uncharacterized protein n=1 Tax=Gnomoniopsis smithogilvyi TaxID=1191159 RepID=A0A9W8YWN4_9PEZI|nr:hypothetical protein N0V93_002404 [Gnomoniopsis smithogilvyi]